MIYNECKAKNRMSKFRLVVFIHKRSTEKGKWGWSLSSHTQRDKLCRKVEAINLAAPLSRSHRYQKGINHDRPLTVPTSDHDGGTRPHNPLLEAEIDPCYCVSCCIVLAIRHRMKNSTFKDINFNTQQTKEANDPQNSHFIFYTQIVVRHIYNSFIKIRK